MTYGPSKYLEKEAQAIIHPWVCFLTQLEIAVSWRSRKQSILVDSTTKAEYVAVAEATKEIVWLRKILEDLQEKQENYTIIDRQYFCNLAS